MAKEFDPLRLDLRRFAEEAAELDADAPLRSFGRLLGETEGQGADRPLHWHAQGELRNPNHLQPQVWVHLGARANLPLVCQRCLMPVDVGVAFERSFRFVADEATAASEDDAAEEDVLALSRSFDLVELVEDEMLMELPVAPRHDVCPEPVAMSAVDPQFEAAGGQRENPFAVLGKLKTGKS
jgi:uncharacterized protein